MARRGRQFTFAGASADGLAALRREPLPLLRFRLNAADDIDARTVENIVPAADRRSPVGVLVVGVRCRQVWMTLP
jgi:hypothetical protein